VIIESGTRAADEHAEAWDQVSRGDLRRLRFTGGWKALQGWAVATSACSTAGNLNCVLLSLAVGALPTWCMPA
jgi:hypothetical protein